MLLFKTSLVLVDNKSKQKNVNYECMLRFEYRIIEKRLATWNVYKCKLQHDAADLGGNKNDSDVLNTQVPFAQRV